MINLYWSRGYLRYSYSAVLPSVFSQLTIACEELRPSFNQSFSVVFH